LGMLKRARKDARHTTSGKAYTRPACHSAPLQSRQYLASGDRAQYSLEASHRAIQLERAH
jgi:hypothetical protein